MINLMDFVMLIVAMTTSYVMASIVITFIGMKLMQSEKFWKCMWKHTNKMLTIINELEDDCDVLNQEEGESE